MRKKKKRFISGLLCLALSGSLLFGCGKEKETMDNNDVSNGQQEITDHSETKLPEQETQDDKQTPEKDKENSTADTSKIPEAEYVDITFDLLENYREKNIPSVYTEDNENEICCNVILNKENQIEYYTVAEETDGYLVWKYTLTENPEEQESSNGTIFSWEKEAVSWLEGIKKEISYGRITAFTGEDQKEYAWYIADGEISHLVKRDGDSFVEIPLIDWSITEIAVVDVLENGNIVSADAGKKCSIYDQNDGSLLTDFPCGFYQSLCVKKNQVYIADRTGSSVQHYDAEKQEFRTTIQGDFDNSIRLACQEDNIYVCCWKGIYQAKENSRSFQKILKSDMYHFSKEMGNLLKFFVVGDAFYVLYGEDKGTLKKYFPAAETVEAADTLTIYSLEKNDAIIDMLSEFQNMYPDIKLIYETGEGSEGSTTAADRIRALNVRILAGDGPDILVLDGLPAETYAKKGILSDLTPVLESVWEDLLPNVLDVYTVEGKLPMLPIRLSIPMFLVSDQVPEEALFSLQALVEFSEEKEGIGLVNYSYSDFLEILYYNYTPEFVMEDGTVDREEIAKFLELVKRFCESEGAVEKSPYFVTYLQGRGNPSPFATGEVDFQFVDIKSAYHLGTFPGAAEARGGKFVGNNGIFFPNGILGINALSGKSEQADLFLSFAFSYEIQKREPSLSGYPIHKKVLEEFAQLDNSMGSIGNSEIALRGFTKQESEQMVQLVGEAKTPFVADESIWEILQDVSYNYFKGTKELEESADEITNRIQLYLYEQ